MLRICLLFALALVLAAPAGAEVRGRIEVIDGDTLRVGRTKVRLHGIDAPELDQTCRRKDDGRVWDCGAWSAQAVRAAYEGRQGRCDVIDRDKYGRIVGRCFVGGEEINARIVEAGYAAAYLRYSRRYIDAEKEASLAGRGIWSSEFARPEAYRTTSGSQSAPTPGCEIKGNISRAGRIYHVPGQENYGKTRIDTSRGERWFCSEAEARAAGWRRAGR